MFRPAAERILPDRAEPVATCGGYYLIRLTALGTVSFRFGQAHNSRLAALGKLACQIRLFATLTMRFIPRSGRLSLRPEGKATEAW